ncbi:MAG TPA: anhydro-N-acetylmuramic acid kinase [Terriglobales bacterium]|nr:anhydro-N-acetylmuramic acid kinase [Terriglobales bacterium]
MIVAGVMSGTSADGIDVAVVRLYGRGVATRMRLLGHLHRPYPKDVRAAVLGAMNARTASVADLARLNFALGELYAEAVLAARRRFAVKLDLVGCHGQTIYHQGTPARFLGHDLTCTWQTGEGAVVAARTGVPVVSDFRPADMAAGGKGAPLVPFVDYMLYRHALRARIAQNIGGIANLTAIPAGAKPEQIIAFDSGPGNMVIDACMQQLFRREYDREGRVAAAGKPIERVLRDVLRQAFFQAKPPKSAGREEFGREFAREFIRRCGRARKEDIVATATALTARSIASAVSRFAVPRFKGKAVEMIVAGGGTRNRTLMRMLEEELKPLRVRVRNSEAFGVPAEAKEAAAFAVLAYATWHREPSNLPSATGAKRPAILGKISHA